MHHKRNKITPLLLLPKQPFRLHSLSVQKTNTCIPICNPWSETKGESRKDWPAPRTTHWPPLHGLPYGLLHGLPYGLPLRTTLRTTPRTTLRTTPTDYPKWSNLVPRAFSSTIFKMADRLEKTLGKAGITWYKISKNLGDFYHVTFWEKPKQNGGEGEAKHRSKDALTLYTRQRWLRSKMKYYLNGCFDSGAGIFSICKFIPFVLAIFLITVTEIRLNIKENKYRVKKQTLCGLTLLSLFK